MTPSPNPLGELLLTDEDAERFDPEDDEDFDFDDEDDDGISLDLELTAGHGEDRGAYIEGTLRLSID